MLNYQQNTRENYKGMVIVFRFLFFALGLLMTGFCTKTQPNLLPAPFSNPVVIMLSLAFFQVMFAFITARFIYEKIVIFLVVFADIAFGIFLSYFFGADFFALACILPLVEVVVFMGLLMTLVTSVVMLLIYFPLLGQLWSKLQKAGSYPYIEAFSAQIKVYFAVILIIFIFFYRLFRSEVAVANKEKEFLKIKDDADKETSDIKNQMKELCNEISHKQDAVQRLHFEVQNKSRELKEVEERLNEIMYQGQELLNIAQEKEEKSVEELKRQSTKIKHRLDYLEDRVSSLTKLINIFQNLNLSAHMEETYSNIIKMVSDVMPSQTVVMFMLKMVNNSVKLNCEAASTPYKTYFENLNYAVGEGVIGWAAQHKKTIVISNSYVETGGEELTTLLAYEKSAIIIPLMYNENVLGVIYLGRVEPDGFTQDDIERVNLFTKLLSVALKFVKDYHMDISSGIKDNATDLYTSYYFKERLADEFARSQRYNYPTALIVASLDNFEAIREKYNSVVVNAALKEVGDLLISHSRTTDVVGRLGNNEFILLLIQTDKNEAILIAERLRMAIGVRIFGKTLGEKINVQASIGLTVYDNTLSNSDEFFKKSEKALLLAKQKGGNTTVIV